MFGGFPSFFFPVIFWVFFFIYARFFRLFDEVGLGKRVSAERYGLCPSLPLNGAGCFALPPLHAHRVMGLHTHHLGRGRHRPAHPAGTQQERALCVLADRGPHPLRLRSSLSLPGWTPIVSLMSVWRQMVWRAHPNVHGW